MPSLKSSQGREMASQDWSWHLFILTHWMLCTCTVPLVMRGMKTETQKTTTFGSNPIKYFIPIQHKSEALLSVGKESRADTFASSPQLPASTSSEMEQATHKEP